MTRPHVMIAPNGARRGKSDHPALPVTITETVKVAVACHAAGADALHLHVRDETGAHSLDTARYRDALAALQDRLPEMAVQITTESGGRFDVSDQLRALADVKPASASIAIREIARSPDLIDRIYATCADQDTQVQHILYDNRDAAVMQSWQNQGLVRSSQRDVILVLGQYDPPVPAAPDMLEPRLKALPKDTPWSVCAFGASEQGCLVHAAGLGGAVRVGFENNLCHPSGRAWNDMTEAVQSLRAATRTET